MLLVVRRTRHDEHEQKGWPEKPRRRVLMQQPGDRADGADDEKPELHVEGDGSAPPIAWKAAASRIG